MRELWIPGLAGPHDDFVGHVHRQIHAFMERTGVGAALVEVELRDGARFALDSLSPEPGYGFVTLRPHRAEEPDAPEELIVPLGSIDRIELNRVVDRPASFGFTLPNEVGSTSS